MMFEWECVGDFMHEIYYLNEFICIYLQVYWVKLDLIKLLKPVKMIKSHESELPQLSFWLVIISL